MARHGQLALEAYYTPYDANTKHRLFSVSKSFTSIAIGLLCEEGKLSLNDPIVSYFADMLPANPHPPYLTAMTIENMLSMETCHSSTTYKTLIEQGQIGESSSPIKDRQSTNKENLWVKSFFTTVPTHKPGTIFNYDTSSTHVLGALVEKLSGQNLLDYLQDKVLRQIAFSQTAYMLTDPYGLPLAGSGLMATPMDLMLFATLIMNGGTYKGEQLLPPSYVTKATKLQSHTLLHGQVMEELLGYGYQFWLIRHNGFALYGMGGQLAICLPEQDLIIVTTADTQGQSGGNQHIYDSIYESLLPFIKDHPIESESSDYERLQSQLSTLSIKPLPIKKLVVEPYVSSNTFCKYKLKPNSSDFDYLSIEIKADQQEGSLILTTTNAKYSIPFGLGHMKTCRFPIYHQKSISCATWLNSQQLYIKSHIIDECIGSVQFHLSFDEHCVSVYMKKNCGIQLQ